jgi:ankyrin repeat protein
MNRIMSKETISKFVQNNVEGSPDKTIAVWDKMLRDGLIPNVNVQDITYSNFTALMYQASYGTEEGMLWLLTREPPADIDMQDDSGYTALGYAVYHNNPAKVRFLLDHKANRSLRDDEGYQPLHYANKYSDTAIIELLENYYPGKNRSEKYHILCIH